MEDYNKIMSGCALFKNIKAEDFQHLLSCLNSHVKIYKSDEYIFLAGSKVDFVGVVISGSLELIKENPAGTRYIMDFLEPSHIFAEGIVCTSERISPVTLRAKVDSKVLFIPFERITRSCGNACTFHVQMIQNMMMILGEKNYKLNSKIELLTLKGMRKKLAAYLLNESKRSSILTFQILPNRNELAEILNVSRTSMCRELAKLKEESIIDYYQRSFQILSPDKLKECLM